MCKACRKTIQVYEPVENVVVDLRELGFELRCGETFNLVKEYSNEIDKQVFSECC